MPKSRCAGPRNLGAGAAAIRITRLDKLTLQAQAKEATNKRLLDDSQPKKCPPFDSIEDMLTCIPRDDLAAMAAEGFEGAGDALVFRDKVIETVGRLLAREKALAGHGAPSAMARDAEVINAFERLESLAEGGKPKQAFVAREVNRNPRLDELMTALRRQGGGGAALRASLAMNEKLQRQAHVEALLREVLIPKRVHEDSDGAAGDLLRRAQEALLKANSAREVNKQLMHVIEYYEQPWPDPPALLLMPAPPPKIPRDKPFADELRKRLLKS